MKAINTYILEKLHINNTIKIEYMYHPKDKHELIKCIKEKIEKEGVGTKEKPLDLNDIDTSKITDMSHLFDPSYYPIIGDISDSGYFDISDWNVSNVENMIEMFANSHFKGDISKWNVSKVKYMNYMFYYSDFNGDISDWDVHNVINMRLMFSNCKKFNYNLDKWNPINVKDASGVFLNSPLEKNPPKWYEK